MTSSKNDAAAAFYETKTTSAGYRFPVYKRPQTAMPRPPAKSEHQSSSGRKSAPLPRQPADPLNEDRIWTETLLNQRRRNAVWETHWGFLTEFDPLGRPKQVRRLPNDAVSAYSTTVPLTDSRQYGSRVATPVGHKLQALEFSLYANNRKRRLGNEFVCY
jgi:hypothetical protein